MPVNDVSKLPKWAQDHIRTLEHQLKEALGYNESLGSVGGRIAVQCGLDRVTYFPGDYEHVRFTVNRKGKDANRPHNRYWMDVRLEHDAGRGDWLYISGEQALKIVPEASNSFRVAVQDIFRPEEETP